MFNFRGKKLLVISPHPDDEIIGCAGLIQRVKQEGGQVFLLFFTVADTKDFSASGLSTEAERKDEIQKVADLFGYDAFDVAFPGDKYHLQLDTVSQKNLINSIERESKVSLEKIKPDIIAFPTESSYNQDHRAVAKATIAALRPAPSKFKHLPPLTLIYEEPADNWSNISKSSPNFFIPLTEEMINKKEQGLRLYSSQYRESPSIRSAEAINALAILRGAECGQKYAEAFFTGRVII